MDWSTPQIPEAMSNVVDNRIIVLAKKDSSRPKSFKLLLSPRERVDCECEYSSNAGPLDEVEAGDEGLRFDAVDDETPGEVGGEEDAEARALAPLPLHGAEQES